MDPWYILCMSESVDHWCYVPPMAGLGSLSGVQKNHWLLLKIRLPHTCMYCVLIVLK